MRRAVVPVLIGVNVALAGVLAWLWIGPGGQLRETRWTPPAAIKPDFSAPLASLAQRRTDTVGQMLAISERPLFSPTRRPPPPPPPPTPPPPPDPLRDMQLLGVYSNGAGGGIIARAEGRVRRVSVNEQIGDWTLQKIQGRDVTFVRGAETRVFQLPLPRGAADAPAAPATPPAPPAAGLPAPGTAGTAAPPATPMTGAQRAEEEERARLRYINEMNIRNGLPPVTHR